MQASKVIDRKVEIHVEGQSISPFLKFPGDSPGQGNHDIGELVRTEPVTGDRRMRQSVRLRF